MHIAKRLMVFLIGVVILSVTTAFAQSAAAQASPLASFDVASIRPMNYDDSARTHIYNSPHNSDFRAINVTLRALMEVAYDLPETQMIGGPAWTSTAKFDLEAKSDAEVNKQMAALSDEQGKAMKREMLRALLADRFKVAAHNETREMPIFALVVAKGGSKLVKSNANGTTMSGGRGKINIKGGSDSLAILAFELSWRLGRPVIDRTGLEGRYELTLNWAADDGEAIASDMENGPSLFTAIQEQLGLKLESTKGPVKTLVIDHAEKPSEN
jgi:uncharacterized protein (TIGR03435 family)